MRTVEWIVVHTSATADKKGNVVDASAEQIRRYHVEHNGWKDIGYHFVVRMDGRVEAGRPIEQEGAHVGGFNEKTIGICCSGHGDIAAFTVDQRRVLVQLCAQLCARFRLPNTVVIGHREADDFGAPHVDKTCPGTKVDMFEIRGDVAVALQSVTELPPWAADLARRVAALEARLGPA